MARKRITIAVQYVVTEREGKYADAETLRDALIEHMSHKDVGIREDYDKDADGGYDGAYITSARIALSTIETI